MKQIKGFKNYSITNTGAIYNHELKRFINQTNHPKGYKMVVLRENSKEFRFLVHRLVALTYIPNDKNKPQVNHINGIKNDNRVENLEWVTAKENTKHAWNIGLRTSKDCLFNYLNSKIVLDLNTGIFYNSMAEVSKLYNIKYQTLVKRIKTGKNTFVLV
jgi:hypothetical protein